MNQAGVLHKEPIPQKRKSFRYHNKQIMNWFAVGQPKWVPVKVKQTLQDALCEISINNSKTVLCVYLNYEF